jgi:hypothetical protein
MSKFSGFGCRIQQLSSLFYAASTARLTSKQSRARSACRALAQNEVCASPHNMDAFKNPKLDFGLSAVMMGLLSVGFGNYLRISTRNAHRLLCHLAPSNLAAFFLARLLPCLVLLLIRSLPLQVNDSQPAVTSPHSVTSLPYFLTDGSPLPLPFSRSPTRP